MTVAQEIVMLGGGHSNAVALRHLGRSPIPGARLTLISSTSNTAYSGMLPGYIAGHYTYGEMQIDLRLLANYAGARLVLDEAIGIDPQRRRVLCRSGNQIPYDYLSINIGSTPQVEVLQGAAHVVPVKPISNFNQHWLRLLERVKQHSGPMRIAVAGGGAGGVELVLAMQYRLRKELKALHRDADDLRFSLLTRDSDILLTHNARVRAHFKRILEDRGISVYPCAEVTSVEPGKVSINGQYGQKADEVVWVASASGATWLRETHLQLNDRGFIEVGDSLQSVNDERIFAAGDIAAQINHPREKAGVIAVRQGRPLADNLRAATEGKPMRPYRPQSRWLALISTGDHYAVASRGLFSWAGRGVWYWKRWLDRRFMAQFATPNSSRPACLREEVTYEQ